MELFHIPFTVQVADVDETMEDLPTEQAVGRLSYRKAAAVNAEESQIVIGADTIVVLEGTVLGKPRSEAQAVQMLTDLSGRDHQVMTGLTVLRGSAAAVCTEVTDIHFRELSDQEIRSYIATGEPMDKAGSYGIQGGAALFAERISGDYFNVVGLRVCQLGNVLRQLAPQLMEETV